MVKQYHYPPMPPKEACDVFLKYVESSIEMSQKDLKKYGDLGFESAVSKAQTELRVYENCKRALINYLNGATYTE
ncbi:hypothetical protein NIE88_05055 [Sporolactobacillus shoreicorticis]|uniref:Uncharacterized protein n=1 Tax=Sporolactobacillus shoreicorticis TaxID=1923877 RepID=A0ABW5S0H8_9BACL|nr:hypothetical protein [Sporolactobacillus shoreicorticis]MCO7125142.1 hypothetical protein [Sporolactobacillus shoreicorticis]